MVLEGRDESEAPPPSPSPSSALTLCNIYISATCLAGWGEGWRVGTAFDVADGRKREKGTTLGVKKEIGREGETEK